MSLFTVYCNLLCGTPFKGRAVNYHSLYLKTDLLSVGVWALSEV